jgi:uncharacterized protein YndB with AHSA1/START domain
MQTEERAGLICKTVLIQAHPAVIYQALTEARDLAHWFCDRVSSEPRVGGELRADWKTGKDSTRGRAIFTRIVPDEIVELRWVDDGQGPLPEDRAHHVLTYTIRSRRGTTEVVMCDSDRPMADTEAFECLNDGWNSVLLELKDYCERKERSSKRRSADARPTPDPE